MRRFVLSAIACVAFAGSSFASNEVTNEVTEINNAELAAEENVSELEKVEFAKTCVMSIKDKNGNILGTVYVTDVPDNVSCNSQAVKDVAVGVYLSNSRIIVPSN